MIVTAVLGDRKPAELHLFRNYDPPQLPGEKTMHVLLTPGVLADSCNKIIRLSRLYLKIYLAIYRSKAKFVAVGFSPSPESD